MAYLLLCGTHTSLSGCTPPSHGKIMVAPPFYNALYGINYRLPNVTSIAAVGIYSVVHVVKWGSNHDIARAIMPETIIQSKCSFNHDTALKPFEQQMIRVHISDD